MRKMTARFIAKEQFPLVVEPKKSLNLDAFLELLKEENEGIRKNLLHYGAILFRNCPIRDELGFEAAIQALDLGQPMDLTHGNGPLQKEEQLRHGLSFLKAFPKHVYFFCQKSLPEGSEAAIADARQVFIRLDEQVRGRFIEKGLKYTSRFSCKAKRMGQVAQCVHRTWQKAFEAAGKDEIERKCRENEFEFQWEGNDWIQISFKRPAAIKHPVTQDNVWFNQAHLYDCNPRVLGWPKYLSTKLLQTKLSKVSFADGISIPRQDLYHIMDVLETNMVCFPWQKGDVLILDNMLSMHAAIDASVLTAMTD